MRYFNESGTFFQCAFVSTHSVAKGYRWSWQKNVARSLMITKKFYRGEMTLQEQNLFLWSNRTKAVAAQVFYYSTHPHWRPYIWYFRVGIECGLDYSVLYIFCSDTGLFSNSNLLKFACDNFMLWLDTLNSK